MKENKNSGSKNNREGYWTGIIWRLIETVYICDSQTVSRLPHGAAGKSQGHDGIIKILREMQ